MPLDSGHGILFIILLVSLLQRINGDINVIKEQKEIATRPHLIDNFGETPSEPIIISAITEDDEKFDDNKLREFFRKNFKLYKYLERERNRNDTLESARKTRDAVNDTSEQAMECLSCYANGSSRADENCYKAHKLSNIKKVKCSDAEQCYVELHPNYIKRGCILYGRQNRTFYCKCPLCNDKLSSDYTYYDYKTYSDWAYDNFLLQKHLKGMDGMCKVCETAGTNALADKNCRLGSPADYMVCGHNQVCYINIDDEVDHVSRGCKTRPVYNSLYYFCNNTLCNNASFANPNKIFNDQMFRLMQSEIPNKIMKKKASSGSTQVNFNEATLFPVLILLLACQKSKLFC